MLKSYRVGAMFAIEEPPTLVLIRPMVKDLGHVGTVHESRTNVGGLKYLDCQAGWRHCTIERKMSRSNGAKHHSMYLSIQKSIELSNLVISQVDNRFREANTMRLLR